MKHLREIQKMLDLSPFAEGRSCSVLGLEEVREVIGYT